MKIKISIFAVIINLALLSACGSSAVGTNRIDISGFNYLCSLPNGESEVLVLKELSVISNCVLLPGIAPASDATKPSNNEANKSNNGSAKLPLPF